MRRAVAAVAVALACGVLLAPVGVAWAGQGTTGPGGTVTTGPQPGTIVGVGSTPGHPGGPVGVPQPGVGVTDPGTPVGYYPPGSGPPTDPALGCEEIDYAPPCLGPPDPEQPAPIVEIVITPGPTLAAQWKEQAKAPAPGLSVDPDDRAVTGLPAYLSIDPHAGWGFAFGPAGAHNQITGTCQPTGYEVSWGDDSGTIPYPGTDTGGPYPGGDITHTYQDAGSFTITVTEDWACAWAAAGDGTHGVVDIASQGALPIPVNEIQTTIN
jgi:hypothetical protein